MAEYSSLKVPELKKLLSEKGLPLTGNKADLIARLQENDKAKESAEKLTENKEDEINYSDDEAPAPAAKESTADEAPASESAPAETTAAAEPAKPAEDEKPAEEKPAEPAPSFALGLTSSSADEEAKKRADRAKRFGLEEDEDAKKRADRAKRFGIDEKALASGLDSALPERPLKRGRGREGGDGEGNRPGKRQSLDRRSGGRRRGRGGRGGQPPRDGGAKRSSVQNDPADKAKAEARKARFASS